MSARWALLGWAWWMVRYFKRWRTALTLAEFALFWNQAKVYEALSACNGWRWRYI